MPLGPSFPACGRVIGRVALTTVAVILALGAAAAPAAADSAVPTNFESVIDDVRPEPEGVTVEVVGGDAFLQVRADRGVEVEIPGYDGEPYLRIEADGEVRRNERSAATFLNTTRGGNVGVPLPDSVDADAEPEWTVVGSDGVVAWHDHRIHWMLGDVPGFDEGEIVQVWMVPMQVDGTDVEVSGRLLYRSDQLPWAVVVGVAGAIGAWFASRRNALRLALVGTAASSALALSLVEFLSQPEGAAPSMVPVAVAAAAVLAAITAALLRAPTVRRASLLAAVALVTGWFVGSVSTMWMPVLPGPVPDLALRSLTAAVFGVAVGVAASILVNPELATTTERNPAGPPQDSNRRSSGSHSWTPPRS